MAEWFLSSAEIVAAVAAVTAAMYVSLLVAVRLAGRRALAQVSAFDVIITIALGSMFATTVVARDPRYLEGLTAVVTLLLLQVLVSALRRKFALVRRFVDFSPVTLVEHGERVDTGGALGPWLTDTELRSALRQRGFFDLQEVEVAILEPTGEISASGSSPNGRLRPSGEE